MDIRNWNLSPATDKRDKLDKKSLKFKVENICTW